MEAATPTRRSRGGDDGCTTCAGRGGDEKAGRVHELHDEEGDDGDGHRDARLLGPTLTLS